jgi:DNA-binding response OmpR family regulator
MRVADLELNRVERSVKRGTRRIELTPKEFGLLEYLMRNAGQRAAGTRIIQLVWNLSFDTMQGLIRAIQTIQRLQPRALRREQRRASSTLSALTTEPHLLSCSPRAISPAPSKRGWQRRKT